MVFRQITDELMYEIRELTGQDYVDTYATKPAAPTASVETLETTAHPEMPGAAGRRLTCSAPPPSEQPPSAPRKTARAARPNR